MMFFPGAAAPGMLCFFAQNSVLWFVNIVESHAMRSFLKKTVDIPRNAWYN